MRSISVSVMTSKRKAVELKVTWMLSIVLLLVITTVPCAGGEPAIYYVATTGDDASPGTALNPWRTIQHAADVAEPGDTVRVGPGTYAENMALTKSGVPDKPITFESNPKGAAIIDGTGVTGTRGLLDIDNANYITVSGFEIRNSTRFGIAIEREATHLKLQNLHVHNSAAETQVSIDGPMTIPAFSTISGCKVHDGPGGGITVWTCLGGYWLIKNNEVYNNAGVGNWDGIQVEGVGGTHHVVVKNNLIHDNATGGGEGADNLDLTGHRLRHHFLVEGNDVYGGGGAFKLHSGVEGYTPGVSSFHIARFNRFTGIPYVCYNFPNPIVLYNNTFIDGNQTIFFAGGDTMSSLGDSTYSGGDTGRMNWKNNLIFQEKPSLGGGVIYEMPWNLIDMTYASVRFQHTLYKMAAGSAIHWQGSAYGATAEDFAAYQASGAPDYPDTGSILTTATTEQTFIDYAARNYHIVVNSPAIDAGMPLTVATNSGTDSTTLAVDRASYFFDGFPVNGEYLDTPDTIVIGNGLPVSIVSITDADNTITLASPRNWTAGDSVTLPYKGSAPDIGAFELDLDPPTPVITGPSSLTSTTRTLTITFGEHVNGFSLPAGISVTNGTASNLQATETPGTYTVDIMGSATATVSVSIPGSIATDDSENANTPTAAPFTYPFDVRPTPVITGAATLTNTTRTLTIAFGENVNGFSLPAGVSVTNGTASNLQPTGTPGTYTVDVLGTGTVTVSVSIPEGVATNDATSPNNATEAPFTFPFDGIAPTASITLDDSTPTAAEAVHFSVDFNESVASFTAADVTVTGTLSGTPEVSGTNPNYTVTVTLAAPSANGTVGISVGTAVTDLAGNPYAGGSSSMYTYLPKPTLTVNITPDGAVTAGAQWSIDSGTTWNAGGAKLTLEAGSYTLIFKALESTGGCCAPTVSWTPPANQTVALVLGDAKTLTGTYVQGSKALEAGASGDLLLMLFAAGSLLIAGTRGRKQMVK